jgi:hypothetical protein
MFKPDLRYERTSDDPGEQDPFAKAKMETARWAGEKLNQHYPGHPWLVQVEGDRFNAVVMIQIMGIMPADRWYLIKFRNLLTDAGGRMIMKAGGELLERYGMPRHGFSLTAWKDALSRYPITGRGHLEPLR